VVVRVPARPGAWLDRWLADVGEPLGAGRYRIGVSQAELARREGISPGTVQERIRRLDTAGLVVSRNPLVIRTEAPSPERVESTSADGERNVRCREAISAMVRLMDVYGVTPALKAALEEMVAALDAGSPAGSGPREVPRLWGLPAADPRPGKEDGQEISIQSPLLLAVPDDRPVVSVVEPRDAAEGRAASVVGERTAWDGAVAVLSAACRERAVPDRPHRPDALWRVAVEVSAEERTAAIDRVTAQVRSGDPVKDPFGLLYRVIEQRQPEYLRPPEAVDQLADGTDEVSLPGAVGTAAGPQQAAVVEAQCAARRAVDDAAREAAERLDAEAMVASAALADDALAAVMEVVTATMPGPLARSSLAISREVVRWCRAARARRGGALADAVTAALAGGVTVGEGRPLELTGEVASGTEPLHRRVGGLLAEKGARRQEDDKR